MSTNYPVNPRVRAYGKARIDIAQRAKNPTDWEKLWKTPSNHFPFIWGESWKHCVEYKVDDFAAEVGFFIDVLGLPVNAFDPGYAMFTSPQGDFFLSIVPSPQGEPSTPPDAIRLQFMLIDIFATTRELENRGIAFEQLPEPVQPGSSLYISYFRTPHGICVDLWGMVKDGTSPDTELRIAQQNRGAGEFGKNGEFDGDKPDEDEGELDENGDDIEFDEDDDDEDDELDQDEDRAKLGFTPKKSNPTITPPMIKDARSNNLDLHSDNQNTQNPEYIDLDSA